MVVHKARPHQRLCDLIPGHRSHCVAHNASIPAQSDIRGPGSNIHQRQIQQADVLRDGCVQGRNRLQGQARHLKSRLHHHCVQAVHHFAGQKGSHHGRLQHLPCVSFQAGHGVMVKPKLCNSVPHQKHPLLLLLILKGAFRRCHRLQLQLADPLSLHDLRSGELQTVLSPLRSQGSAGRSHTSPLQLSPAPLLQALRHLGDYLCHLPDIFDLSIQHGTSLMRPPLHFEDPHFILLLPGQQPDHASGPNVQCIDQILFLVRVSAGLFHGITPLRKREGYLKISFKTTSPPRLFIYLPNILFQVLAVPLFSFRTAPGTQYLLNRFSPWDSSSPPTGMAGSHWPTAGSSVLALPSFSRKRWIICFMTTAWEESSSLAAADSSLVAELVWTTAEI